MRAQLSFEQAPPFDVPLRFLATAPWFGVAAGLLLAWSGEAAVVSRWTPHALAVVHLLVVGYLLQAMIGALLQFVPVAAGGNVWQPRWTAGILHPALVLGACVLAIGLYRFDGAWLRTAAAILLGAAMLAALIVGSALWRTPARGGTVAALRLAAAGLAITVVLGAALAEGVAGGHSWPLIDMTNVHAAWGLGGWILMLVIGVSYLVVPMFQLTPQYPARCSRWVPVALFVALVLWSLQAIGLPGGWTAAAGLTVLAVPAAYAVSTLRLQAKRRRKITDPTFWFFRGAMLCLLAAVMAGIAMAFVDAPFLTWWFGVLTILGTFVSLVAGMSYKIVPFLGWLHLQRQAGIGGSVPTMREIIPEGPQRAHFNMHFAAVVLLLLAGAVPQLVVAGGLMFAISCGWQGWVLAGGVRHYRRFKDRVRAAGARQES